MIAARSSLRILPRSFLLGTLTTVAICTLLLPAGCERPRPTAVSLPVPEGSTDPSQPPHLPAPVLALEAPPLPPAVIDGRDASKDNTAVLHVLAFQYAGKGSFRKAAQCQHWLVQRTDQGRYDLACWESLAGRTEAALYWLQEAGRLEGVNTKWAEQDPDLEKVRADARWPKLLAFLRQCERYWRAVAHKETVVITPKKYDGKSELPVVVWLHGMGGDPTNMQTDFQTLADRHQIGFIGVSGTIPTGKQKFAWADVAEEDFERIRQALAEADTQIRRRPGAVALGFSQGAMVAIEAAVRHPETFAGAITISAGTGSPVQLESVSAKAHLPHQGFVIVCGAKENKWSVRRSNELASWLQSGGARVLKPNYPQHATHSIPADFSKRLPEWLAFIERARKTQP